MVHHVDEFLERPSKRVAAKTKNLFLLDQVTIAGLATLLIPAEMRMAGKRQRKERYVFVSAQTPACWVRQEGDLGFSQSTRTMRAAERTL